MFTLNDKQLQLLAAIRAWREEGEQRFEFWSRREAQAAASASFGAALAESGLAAGRPLSPETRDQLLRSAAELAPNGNLSRRLFAENPKAFDDRLRLLLSGTEPLYERVSQFLEVRGTGIQTASSLLCASDPEDYPLLTRPALRRLALTPAQKRDALEDAAAHYGFSPPDSGPPPAPQQILALFVVYEKIRSVLGVKTYPEVDEALRQPSVTEPSVLKAGFTSSPNAQVRETKSDYAPTPPLTETRLLTALEAYALEQGFTFPPHRLRSYYVALKTKPFVILSGVSGTGKTRLAELFAEAMTGASMKQFRLIAVRPEWNDGTALFGYQNVLANRYVSTPFLEIVRRAGLPENRHRAYFVCLDEMNLARVEHYLADYLSALESRAHRIPLHEGVPDLVLPPNLFVTGTVNSDETTHGFSRKVLDRANTFDFDERPEFSRSVTISPAQTAIGDTAERQALFLASRATTVAQAKERLARQDAEFPNRALTALQALNDQLYPHHLHFAYRVRDDILLFLANSFDNETGEGLLLPDQSVNFTLALDLQLLQKVLPKLHGQSDTLLPLLARLQAWMEAEGLEQTATKLARMRASGADTGYLRFYE